MIRHMMITLHSLTSIHSLTSTTMLPRISCPASVRTAVSSKLKRVSSVECCATR